MERHLTGRAEICYVCESGSVVEEVYDDASFGKVQLGVKHWKCNDCGSNYVTGSQMNHNAKCQVIEIEGPFKPIEISSVHHANVYFDWCWNGFGFGQLSFSVDKVTGEIACMNECMSRDRVRELLHAFADHIADKAVLLDGGK